MSMKPQVLKEIRNRYDKLGDKDVEDEIHHLAPTNLLKKENFAIAASYFSVGFVTSFISTPLNIYLVSVLNAEPPMQNTISILQTLPWSLKLLFGFLSDAVPIYGMHRKPYLTIGACVYSFAYFAYGWFGSDHIVLLATCIFLGTLGLIAFDVMADTMVVERSRFESDLNRGQMQASCYSTRFGGGLLGAVLGATVSNQQIWGWGLTFHQIAMINGFIPFLLVIPWLYVLKEKYHQSIYHHESPKKAKPNRDIEMSTVIEPHQGINYQKSPSVSNKSPKPSESSRLLASPKRSSASASPKIPSTPPSKNKLPPSTVIYRSFEPLTSNPTVGDNNINSNDDEEDYDVISLKADDDDRQETHPILLQLYEIWETVQLKAVWRPMTFVYVYNILQVPNVAWQSYLQLSLGFPAWVLGLTVTLGSFMTFAGVLAYKYMFFKASWRSIYVWTSLLTAFFSFLQILLIFQINTKYLHLSNYLFSLGDDVISAYISGIQFLPVCVMYMRLCPDGSEGASYAMLTTFSNIALVCASNVGNMISGIWDVSNEAMRAHNVDGLWKLSVLTSTVALAPLSLLWLLPGTPEEQLSLGKSKEKSVAGGVFFLVVLFGSLIWSICTAISRLADV